MKNGGLCNALNIRKNNKTNPVIRRNKNMILPWTDRRLYGCHPSAGPPWPHGTNPSYRSDEHDVESFVEWMWLGDGEGGVVVQLMRSGRDRFSGLEWVFFLFGFVWFAWPVTVWPMIWWYDSDCRELCVMIFVLHESTVINENRGQTIDTSIKDETRVVWQNGCDKKQIM